MRTNKAKVLYCTGVTTQTQKLTGITTQVSNWITANVQLDFSKQHLRSQNKSCCLSVSNMLWGARIIVQISLWEAFHPISLFPEQFLCILFHLSDIFIHSGNKKVRGYDSFKETVQYVLREHTGWVEYSLKSLVPFKGALITFSVTTIERETFSAEDWHSTHKFITVSKVTCQFFHNKVMWTQSLRPLVTSAYTQVPRTTT